MSAPVVDAAPLVFECRYCRTVEIPKLKGAGAGGEGDNFVIVGEVVAVRVSKSVVKDPRSSMSPGKSSDVSRLSAAHRRPRVFSS